MTEHATTITEENGSGPHDGSRAESGSDFGDPWGSGKTFREMYLDGDQPWPEEPLLQNDRGCFEIADEYLELVGRYAAAQRDEDAIAVRRLRGELDAADAAMESMDTYSKAAALIRVTARLSSAAHDPVPTPPHKPKPAQVLPEGGRFNGPAPFFRRGRAYIQALAPAFTLAAEGHGEFVSRRPDDADQFLRAVEASDDTAELQDFIAGAVHEIYRQLRQLIEHPINEPK